MPTRKQALVAGSSGLLGTHFVRHLEALGDWDVLTLSRKPVPGAAHPHVAVDLLDRAACEAAIAPLEAVTHVFYLSRVVQPDYQIQVDANVQMLENLLGPLERAAPGLQLVQLMHGCKWYGVGIGAFRTPAKETDPRPDLPVYYYGQHDALTQRQQGKAWRWSTLRPHLVAGFGVRSPSNIMAVLAVYATVLKELRMPLLFPGPQKAFDALLMYTDLRLLARAMVWAATAPQCANQDFNMANGDWFRWRDVWPALAGWFGMEPGPVEPMSLRRFMANKEPVWQQAVARHGLAPYTFAEVADWAFADSVFRLEWDQALSVVKAHRHGFHEMVDSESMLFELLGHYRAQRVIP